MFRIQPEPTFACKVPLSVPGKPAPLEVDFTFHYKNKDQLAAWVQDATGKDDATLLGELIEGWDGMVDAKGNPVHYSITALHTLIYSYWAARDEITRAYMRELKESKTKNS
jgi:hypothetical protein